jgi:hypothetical protein
MGIVFVLQMGSKFYVKRYCLVNFVWPFVKTDDDCVYWKNAKYGHQFCIKNIVEIKPYIIIYYIYRAHAHARQMKLFEL